MRLKQKPSNKTHRRYLLIENSEEEEIKKIILDYIGILGWAKADPIFVKDNKLRKKVLILAVERKSVEDIRASFELCNEKVKIIKVSGTLKGLER